MIQTQTPRLSPGEAEIVDIDGAIRTVILPAADLERLSFLQGIVGGFIEAIPLPGCRFMVLNSDGKSAPHYINKVATRMAHECKSIQDEDYIAGVAVIVPKEALE